MTTSRTLMFVSLLASFLLANEVVAILFVLRLRNWAIWSNTDKRRSLRLQFVWRVRRFFRLLDVVCAIRKNQVRNPTVCRSCVRSSWWSIFQHRCPVSIIFLVTWSSYRVVDLLFIFFLWYLVNGSLIHVFVGEEGSFCEEDKRTQTCSKEVRPW